MLQKNTAMLAFAFIITLLAPQSTSADHSWGGYHWARTANPFTLKLGDNLNSSWDPYLVTTANDWTTSLVLDTTIVAGNTNNLRGKNTPKNCTPTSGRAEVCNAKYGATGWLGIATIWASGGHITAGTVKMNDTYFSSAPYNTPAWKNLVTCQEVGHLFGLGHQDENFDNINLNTCMDYSNNPESNQHPNSHDYSMLEQLYTHLDTTTTLLAPVTTTLPDSANQIEWGTEVHRSDNGRSSLFVRELGHGNRILRHVFWAEPRGSHHHD